jgi:hypothetical protein
MFSAVLSEDRGHNRKMMEKKYYPIFATDVELTVEIIVDMPADSFQSWLNVSTPYGRKQRNEAVKRTLFREESPDQVNGLENKPVNTGLETSDGTKLVPEIIYFECYQMANERCLVTGTCTGIFSRRTFDYQLVQIGDTFASTREDLAKIVNDPERGKYLPALSEMVQIWTKPKTETKRNIPVKNLNSSFLYGVEGLDRVALGRWSNDVKLLAKCLGTYSLDNKKRRFAGCVFDIPDPIELDSHSTMVWLIHGTNPDERELPDHFGKIRILPRDDEGVMVEFRHDTAVGNFLASYEYIRQLCHFLRICGMVFESDIPSQVELGLEAISSSFYLQSKFQTVKYCLLNTKPPSAFLLLRGSVEAFPISVKRENEASCELSVDGFFNTPKWAKPDESIQYIQRGIISILISDYDPHTKIEITCRLEAFLPFVIKILRALKDLPGEKGDIIQREIDRLMLVDTYSDKEETAVAIASEETLQVLQIPGGRKGGRPKLPEKELIYRLSKVQEAIELRDKENLMWAECASKIKWRYGVGPSGLAQLADARRRLEALQTYDPNNILIQVHDYRQREKKET